MFVGGYWLVLGVFVGVSATHLRPNFCSGFIRKVQLVDDVVLNDGGVYEWFMDILKNPFEALFEALFTCH